MWEGTIKNSLPGPPAPRNTHWFEHPSPSPSFCYGTEHAPVDANIACVNFDVPGRRVSFRGGTAALHICVSHHKKCCFLLLPLLLQVPTLTEILLSDAEVERSAAASGSSSSLHSGEAGVVGLSNSNGGVAGVGVGGVNEGVGGGGGAVAGGPQFRSRRVAPGRLCPVPAVLGGMLVDTDGRAVGGKGAAVLVSKIKMNCR